MSLGGRIGCFLLLVGLALVLLFLVSDAAKTPAYNYLIIGGFIILVGFSMWRAGRPKPTESNRFSALRRMHEAGEERKKKKLQGKH